MKSIIVKIVAIVATAVAIATSSYAAGGGDARKVKVELIQHKDNVVALHFQKPENQVIKIKIIDDATKKVVFSGSKKKHDLAIIKYDLSHLPKGVYTIEVTAAESVFTQRFEF